MTGNLSAAEEKKYVLSEEEKKAIEVMEAYATPSEKHKYLQYFVGEWDSLMKFLDEKGSVMMTGTQTITVKSIFGERFLWATLKGVLYEKPYEAYVITGFNNYKKEIFAFQISSSGTAYFISSGTLSEDNKVRTETGTMDDELTGKKINVKAVTTLIDQDHYTYDFYLVDETGKEIKYMEILYTRKK